MINFVYDKIEDDGYIVPNLSAWDGKIPLNRGVWEGNAFEAHIKSIDGWQEYFNFVSWDKMTPSKSYYYPILFNTQVVMHTWYPLIFFSKRLVEKINSRKVKVLFICIEPTQYSSIEVMNKNLRHMEHFIYSHGIEEPNSITILTADYKFTEISNSLDFHPAINFKYFPFMEMFYKNFLLKSWHGSFIDDEQFRETLRQEPREKEFLCFNHYNHPKRLHRLFLLKELQNRNLDKKGFYSFLCDDIDDQNKIIQNELKRLNFKDYIERYGDIKIEKKIVLDVDTRKHDTYGIYFPVSFYTNSFYSLITETLFDSDDLSGFVTEKTFKAIVNGHPFIVLGNQYILKHIQSLGYITFPELFDETYDDLNSGLEKIISVANNVEKFSFENYKLNFTQIRNKLLYNRMLFFKKDHLKDLVKLLKI